jgi:hypothetical protein
MRGRGLGTLRGGRRGSKVRCNGCKLAKSMTGRIGVRYGHREGCRHTLSCFFCSSASVSTYLSVFLASGSFSFCQFPDSVAFCCIGASLSPCLLSQIFVVLLRFALLLLLVFTFVS